MIEFQYVRNLTKSPKLCFENFSFQQHPTAFHGRVSHVLFLVLAETLGKVQVGRASDQSHLLVHMVEVPIALVKPKRDHGDSKNRISVR